jgi:hypothetical protein
MAGNMEGLVSSAANISHSPACEHSLAMQRAAVPHYSMQHLTPAHATQNGLAQQPTARPTLLLTKLLRLVWVLEVQRVADGTRACLLLLIIHQI